MMKNIDADYYGYMDDDDGLLVPNEEKCEKEAIRKKIEEWKTTETNDVEIDEAYVLPEMNVCFLLNSILLR
jgi:pre-mRNA-splicing factor ISY1